METTFMTIHNLSAEANILYASESIIDILGFHPEEVTGRSCFDYFHPDEIPFARHIHGRGVQLDKASVLHYARIKDRNGQWVGCECVFSVVYEVLVACTSIYRGDVKNERRAIEAPAVRRLFSSSPRDPRYHMLEHMSNRFRAPANPPQAGPLEPRAAVILNRFTRTLSVLFATNAVASILGISPEQFNGKSFYECIQENCLPEAIRCLESAKANDSIAYLRFWYRDPRRGEDFDQEMRDASQSSDSEDGGVELDGEMEADLDGDKNASPQNGLNTGETSPAKAGPSRTSSGESTDGSNAIFDDSRPSRSSTSSLLVVSPDERRRARPQPQPNPASEPFEIEATVSCTSDGLVVILRRARPLMPSAVRPVVPHPGQGLFAAPWGVNPVHPHQYHPDPQRPFHHGFEAPIVPAGGPQEETFMQTIREVAVFAWALAGINGNIPKYAHGVPRGEAQPRDGLAFWDPHAPGVSDYRGPYNQAAQKWAQLDEKTIQARDGNRVPFQHPREEANLRYQHNSGTSPMGSDRPAAAVPPHIGAELAQPLQYMNQNVSYDNPYGHPQSLHGMSAGRAPGMENNPPPTHGGDAHSTGEGSGSNRHLWY